MTYCYSTDSWTRNVINAVSVENGIRDYVHEKPVDMIAICTQGKSGFQQLFTPSIAEWVFGLLIGITIFSFATDYTCLYLFDHSTFEGVPAISESYTYNLVHFIYFSVITFSTVGYGDITPVSGVVKFVVILEIYLSFFMIIFALANIKKIHINE